MSTIDYQVEARLRQKYAALASTTFLAMTLTACQTSSTHNPASPEQGSSPPAQTSSASNSNTNSAPEPEVAVPEIREVTSPVGGTIQKVFIPGPESAVAVACVQQGFDPFFFKDEGENWVGCQLRANESPGSSVSQLVPEIREVTSPVGGTIQKVFIPGPESAVAVACVQQGFDPFFFKDEGENWVGCQQ
jgi:biotin carboxyl carrier protein